MIRALRCWSLLALLLVPPAAWGQAAPSAPAAPSAIVYAVLFYSPTCPHCHKVMTEDLPPIAQRYGSQLRIASVNVATPGGQALYQATVAHFALPDDRLGVPTLVVGRRVLVGDLEIPRELPGLVDRGLAAGGVGWPDVPEIRQAVAQAVPPPAEVAARADKPASGNSDTAAGQQVPRETAGARGRRAVAAPAPASLPAGPSSGAGRGTAPPGDSSRTIEASIPVASATESDSVTLLMTDRFLRDPVGNGASVVVLLAMLAALALVSLSLLGRRVPLPAAPAWVVPALGLVGLGVASYLAVVEVSGAHAVCGPVGDCNTVQRSEYARLFGVLPVGVLGMAGYAGIIGLWLLGLLGREPAARAGRLGAWSLALVATAFSIYLTFLEPFVIGATCAWCLSSAVIAMLLLLVLTPAALRDRPALRVQGGGSTPT
jgi:uncharacterized membrane protein